MRIYISADIEGVAGVVTGTLVEDQEQDRVQQQVAARDVRQADQLQVDREAGRHAEDARRREERGAAESARE